MSTQGQAMAALAHARELAAHGTGLTARLRQERAALLKAIDAELSNVAARMAALRPAARSGDREAGARITAMAEAQADLWNARATLEAQPA